MRTLTTAYIGLGSNLADRRGYINKALKILTETKDIKVARISNLIETTALGNGNQPDYLNAVTEIKTSLSAEDLHRKLIEIEASLGRVREGKWSPRTIDLDLLLFGAEAIESTNLTVPHPQLHLRSFALKGLCQFDAELQHPVMKEPVGELAARLGGADFMLNPNLPQLISVAGIIGVGKTTITKRMSDLFDCEPLLEPYDTNPFMPDVYAGRKELALDSQLYFLAGRTEQLNHNTLATDKIAITDYVFDKELIYAKRLLNAQQLALYEQIYPPFCEKVAEPVLVIYLTDSVQKCLERIHKRNRPYEQKIELQFLEALQSDYDRLFADWKTCPVIRISISKFDYTKKDDVEHLASQMKSYVAGPPVIASAAKQSKT